MSGWRLGSKAPVRNDEIVDLTSDGEDFGHRAANVRSPLGWTKIACLLLEE